MRCDSCHACVSGRVCEIITMIRFIRYILFIYNRKIEEIQNRRCARIVIKNDFIFVERETYVSRALIFYASCRPSRSRRHSDVRLGGRLISLIAGPWFARVLRITNRFWNYVFGCFVHGGLTKRKVKEARPFRMRERERWRENFVDCHRFWGSHATQFFQILTSCFFGTLCIIKFQLIIILRKK